MDWHLRLPPGINIKESIQKLLGKKSDEAESLWIKCPVTGQLVYRKEVEENQWVIPGSEYHMRVTAEQRLALTMDGPWEKVEVPELEADPLKFRDSKRYSSRLKEARKKTGLEEAVIVATGELEGIPVTICVHDFRFIGGSLGIAAGESIIKGFEVATERKTPLIVFTASGGARMQEGIFSLMQMPRTTIARQILNEARLPYIVVLTDPTTGGVTASYAMLGDIHIAEPGAMICFAGPRVIKQVLKIEVDPALFRAERHLEHGMIDMVVHRHAMRATLARLCRLLMVPKAA